MVDWRELIGCVTLPAMSNLLRKHYWLLPAALFLSVSFATVGPSTYFNHLDAAHTNVIGADLYRACWVEDVGRPVSGLLTAASYGLFGYNPLSQIVLLILIGGIGLGTFTILASDLTGSKRWGLLAAVWFITLPTTFYYTRLHMGFPLAFFIIGLMLHVRRQYFPAGVLFALALMSHASLLIPLAAWFGFSFIFDPKTRQWSTIRQLAIGFLSTWLLIEFARFMFSGRPFGWVRDVYGEVRNQSGKTGGGSLIYILAVFAVGNGWLNALIVFSGALYPLVRQRGKPLLDGAAAAGWSVIVFYSIRAAFGYAIPPRHFMYVYPLLAITDAYVLMRLIHLLINSDLPGWANIGIRGGLGFAVLVVLPLTLLSRTLEANKALQTGYPTIAHTFEEAKEAGLPIRFFGAYHVGNYYGLYYNEPVVSNEFESSLITSDTAAVLIFEDASDAADIVGLDPALYDIYIYPHHGLYRPRQLEDHITMRDISEAAQIQNGSGYTELVVWWPKNPSGDFHVEHRPWEYVFYYEGDGMCVIDKPYFDGTTNFYELALMKLRELTASF